jgi:V8-like Glu-specific endopeptidase
MYRCSIQLESEKYVTTVFVVNKNLTLQAGNVISSNQAGGVFHKVSNVQEYGKQPN